MKGIAIPDIADLCDIGLNEPQTISLDGTTPLSQGVVDASSCGSDPLELEVEACRRIVDNVVMQYYGFRLVAFLQKMVRASRQAKGAC